MSVRVTSNTASIKFKNSANIPIAIRYMLDGVDSIANPRTPKNMGNLRKDILKTVIGKSGKIQWAKNYAVYQETKQFKSYTTSGTGPHFAQNAVLEVARTYATYFRKAKVIE